MSEPRITVLIANHNYGHWLVECIDSAVSQDYENKQVCLIDDGSTDNSWKLFTRLLKGNNLADDALHEGIYKGVRLVGYRFPKAGGPSRARNMGIKLTESETDHYAVLDADDTFLPGRLTKLSPYLNDWTGAVYSDYYTENVNTRLRRIEHKEPFSRERLLQDCIVHSACIINKGALSQVGLYDEEMRTCEDYDLWIRISEKMNIRHVAEPTMVVRVGDYNSTGSVPKAVWEKNWQRIADKIRARHQQG